MSPLQDSQIFSPLNSDPLPVSNPEAVEASWGAQEERPTLLPIEFPIFPETFAYQELPGTHGNQATAKVEH